MTSDIDVEIVKFETIGDTGQTSKLLDKGAAAIIVRTRVEP